MKRILFIVWARAGHIAASLGVARRLREIGVEMGFYCHDDPAWVQARLDGAALPLRCLGPSGSAGVRYTPARRAELTKRLQEPDWRLKYFERLLVWTALPQIPAMRAAIREFDPDVVAVDSLCYGGAAGAQLEGRPWATIGNAWDLTVPRDDQHPFTLFTPELRPAQRKFNATAGTDLNFRGVQMVSPHLNLVFGLPELTPPTAALPSSTFLVGPVMPHSGTGPPSFPWDRIEGSFVIYMSPGTEFAFAPEVVGWAVEAAAAAGAKLVVTPGTALAGPSPHAIAVDHAPQLELLPRSRLFISSGGTNSILESLRAGVPLLLLPLGYDQPYNATCVARAGVGRALTGAALTPANLACAVAEMLREDCPERQAMQRLRAKVGGQDGAARAAELVLSLAGTGQRQ